MNRDQKAKLAFAVMQQAANLVEFWDEMARDHGLDGMDRMEAAQQIANWLGRLPGGLWDTRLPDPEVRP